jgi:quinoprotein glucose dehydrogenase
MVAAISRFLGLAGLVGLAAVPGVRAQGWSEYGGPGGRHYAPLSQITPTNVADLKLAWTYRTGDTGAGFPGDEWKSHMAFETTPIFYDDTLYFTTPSTNVVAVNAATGKLRWRVNTHVEKLWYSDAVSRGVSLWVDDGTPADAVCRARIFAPTLDGRLLALDAATGKPCPGFADHGVLSLTAGMHLKHRNNQYYTSEYRNYLVTSPPAILHGKVIVGSSIGDNRSTTEESGEVRAFDARTGKLLWSWDPIPRDAANPVYQEWDPKAAASAGAGNVWSLISVDPARNLVYLPTTSADPDMYGGERPGDDRWTDSLVALDGDTGKLVWAHQLVHHDLWDYDLPAEPVLVELKHDGAEVPAVIQPTKMGLLFTFNRITGQPLFPIVEKPVPTDGVPGEPPSPTQPFPVAPPPLVRTGPVTPADAWGLTFWDEGRCRKEIKQYHSQGIYTPPSFRGSIEQPGYGGGIEWGGLAFDPMRQIAVVNTNNIPMVVVLIPRDKLLTESRSGKYKGWDFSRMQGTPYGMRRKTLLSPLHIPCVKPPWGQLTAVDMENGTIKWQVPFGNALLNHWNLGVPNMGGPIVTASGLIFIAATVDDDIRAFDIHTGKVLWQYHLPAGGQATPMTYAVHGKQYVVIAAGGHGGLGTKRGDYVMAFSLPQ